MVENWGVVIDRAEKVGYLRAAILEMATTGSLVALADARDPNIPPVGGRTPNAAESETLFALPLHLELRSKL